MSLSVINYAIEQSIVSYLSGSLSNPSSSLYNNTASFYTGINNDDLNAPAVIVNAGESREVVLNSQVYEVMVDVEVKEMAWDTNVLGSLALNVFNEFYTLPDGTNSASKWNNSTYNFNAIQVQTIGSRHTVHGDALINTGTFRFVCGLNF